MNRITKYISNVSALQFIQLLRFATLFLVGIVFVRFYATYEIGQYERMIFIAGAVSFFWLQGLLQTFLSLIKKENITNGNKSSAFFNAVLLLLFFSLLSVLFLVVFRSSLREFLNHSEPIPFFKWLLVYVLIGSPANFTEYIYLSLNKPCAIIVYGVISFFFHFIALVLPALFHLGIEYSIIGMIVVNCFRFLWLFVVLYQYSSFTVNIPFVKKHLILAYPLIGSALLSGSAQYIDGLIITRFFDDATFAIFRYGARELPIALILANALSNALIPEFGVLSLKESLAKLRRSSQRLMHILFPLTFVFLVTSQWLFTHVFNPEFLLSAQIFNVYLLLIVSRMLFPQTILIGLQKTKIIMWVSFIEISINILLSIWFVQVWGVLGVAYASVIAFACEKVILVFFVKKKLSINLTQYLPISWFILYGVLTFLIYFIFQEIIFK